MACTDKSRLRQSRSFQTGRKKTDFPPFSVVLCVYSADEPAWFDLAVQSILNQTLPPAEVVLVVDGPVGPELETVISRYQQISCFKVIRFPENRGHGAARNAGLETCCWDLAAMMDADDISMPDRFEKQLKLFAENPKLSAVGGQIVEFKNTPEQIIGYRIVPQTHSTICREMKKRCPMNQVTVMLKRSDVRQAGGYREWYCNEDYYLWLRMYLAGMEFANTGEVLVQVRAGNGMYRRRGGWRYFLSEAKLQQFMLRSEIIGPMTWLWNVAKRAVVQLLLPVGLRSMVFQKFAREKSWRQ